MFGASEDVPGLNERVLDHSPPTVTVDTPLEELVDPWPELRVHALQMAPGDRITVRYGAAKSKRLHNADVADLMRLVGFEPGSPRALTSGFAMEGLRRFHEEQRLSCTIVIPCRNEAGNIDALVRRVPKLGSDTELLFIDGASTDGTVERIQAAMLAYPEKNIRLLHQNVVKGGKGEAVFQAFDQASGDVMMILDADMTVAPEDLPRFFLALAEGHTHFANGVRLTFPMEPGAMQRANYVGNRIFAMLFSWLLDVRMGDTLCGTKVLFRGDWANIAAARPLFGNFDPFGDFDLLFSARYAGLSMMNVPVHYRARTSGETKIHRWRDGISLFHVCLVAVRVFKLRRRR